MKICDFGNTNVHWYDDGRVWTQSVKDFLKTKVTEDVFYICVNHSIKKELQKRNNFVDVSSMMDLDTGYTGMGIDRVAACLGVETGVVVDAGSAITIDIMSMGSHLGGTILPGIASYEYLYEIISPVLSGRINPNISLKDLPQNTHDAISYGVITSIYLTIKELSRDKPIFFTGGDGRFFSKLFNNSIYDSLLVFKGIIKILKLNNLIK